jgi:hypothetical protein
MTVLFVQSDVVEGSSSMVASVLRIVAPASRRKIGGVDALATRTYESGWWSMDVPLLRASA